MKRLSIESCVKVAREKGGVCLSNIYRGTKSKLKWRCKSGHTFMATYNDVKYKGSWCSVCWDKRRSIILKRNNILKQTEVVNKLEKLAKNNDGKLLSETDEYINAHTKLKWECENRHIFLSSYGQVGIMGQWCPYCYTKTQNKIFKIIQDIFDNCEVKQNYQGFDWLRCSKYGKQEIDIYVKEIKLGIEYDGEQHFRPVRFGNMSEGQAEESFKSIQKFDKLKNKKIKEHPEDIRYFVRINYKDRKKINKDFICNKLAEIGVKT
jgi:hypothetical protein